MVDLCRVEGCMGRVFRKGLCQGHMKRLQRSRPVEPPLGSLGWDEAREAILAYSNSDTDEDFEENRRTLLHVLKRWARAGFPCSSTSRRRMGA
jgi:hypothetical protein